MSRSKRPTMSVKDKVRIVLAVLAGEITGAESARRNGVSALSVGKWKARFLEGGRAALEDTLPGPSRSAGTPEQRRAAAGE